MKTTTTAANKTQATKHMVSADVESNLLSKGKKKIPTTGGYTADKATIFSPASRGI